LIYLAGSVDRTMTVVVKESAKNTSTIKTLSDHALATGRGSWGRIVGA